MWQHYGQLTITWQQNQKRSRGILDYEIYDEEALQLAQEKVVKLRCLASHMIIGVSGSQSA